jgi:membrane protease YdiL (CAAX protease family)
MKPMNVNEPVVISSPQNNSGKLLRIIRKYPLISFFTLTYLISTLLWLPAIIWAPSKISDDLHLLTIYVLPGIALGVTGVAFVMAAISGGKNEVILLLKSFVLWRAGFKWYMFVLFALPLSGIAAGALISGNLSVLSAVFAPSSLVMYPMAYLSHFYFGPLFEEAGWRGFALPRMLVKFGALKGTFLLGLLWGLWHLPLYLPINIAERGWLNGSLYFAGFLFSAIALAVIFTWVYNNTKGSLLLAVLLHASVDGNMTYIQTLKVNGIISAESAESFQIGSILVIIMIAILLRIVTRGKLGYTRK